MLEFQMGDGYEYIATAKYEFVLEALLPYNTEGNYIVALFRKQELLPIDNSCWPRYYFDIGVARSEIMAWLKIQGEVE